jgi:hypothetical protein
VRLYAIAAPPLDATTFASKLTSLSPETLPTCPPIPCAVWQVEHEKPSLMCRACSLKLVLARIEVKS